jgi:pimeloyl-ACP methyl ester carboxylesterase
VSSITVETVGGTTVRVWRSGEESKQGLLYLHGFERHPGDSPFLERLAQSHRVIAPEHPGYGESNGLDAMDQILDLVLHYRQFVERNFEAPVDVVGHSLGGMFAAEFAAICPHLTNTLTLVSPYGLWRDDQPLPDPFILNAEELASAKWADPAAASPELALPFPGADEPHAATYDRARNMGAATKFMWPIPDHGLRRRLPLIGSRTLVVHGADDKLIPRAYAEDFVRLIPSATLAVIEQAGHLPMLERPDEFGRLLESFLDQGP